MNKSVGTLLFVTIIMAIAGCSNVEGPKVYNIDITTKCDIPWDENTSATLYIDGDTLPAAVHYRGGFSRKFHKHSMALKFSRKTALCGLPEDNKFVLNASYTDRSFMRHWLSFDLFRSFDKNIAPQCAYVNINVNGKPQGLYVLMQRMDARTLHLDIHDTNAVIFKEPFLFNYRKGYEDDNPYAQKYPHLDYEDHSAQYEQLQDLIFDTLNPDYFHAIDSAIDIYNLADWQITLLLTNNIDGIVKGFYLYKVDNYTKWRFAIWDYDHAFGRDGDGEPNMLKRKVDMNKNIMFRSLMKCPEYRDLLKKQYKNRRQYCIHADIMKRKVKAHAKAISKAAKKDLEIWPNDTTICPYPSTLQQEVEIIDRFIDFNIQRLDSIFK